MRTQRVLECLYEAQLRLRRREGLALLHCVVRLFVIESPTLRAEDHSSLGTLIFHYVAYPYAVALEPMPGVYVQCDVDSVRPVGGSYFRVGSRARRDAVGGVVGASVAAAW